MREKCNQFIPNYCPTTVFIQNISVGLNLNKESTTEHYKKERGVLLTIDLKPCGFCVSGKTHGDNKCFWYKGIFKSGRSRCAKYDSALIDVSVWRVSLAGLV